ncbi:hypothetical protein Tco_0373139 [Tanacetum coccineum]
MELIIMDEQGAKMQATFRMSLVFVFKQQLNEGDAVVLRICHWPVIKSPELDNYGANGKPGKKKPLKLMDLEDDFSFVSCDWFFGRSGAFSWLTILSVKGSAIHGATDATELLFLPIFGDFGCVVLDDDDDGEVSKHVRLKLWMSASWRGSLLGQSTNFGAIANASVFLDANESKTHSGEAFKGCILEMSVILKCFTWVVMNLNIGDEDSVAFTRLLHVSWRGSTTACLQPWQAVYILIPTCNRNSEPKCLIRENVWKTENQTETETEENINKRPVHWQPFAIENVAFDAYYKLRSLLLQLSESTLTVSSLQISGPTQLQDDFMKSLQSEVTDGNDTEGIKSLSWYPDSFAWQSSISRMQLRKYKSLERFHEFLKQENEIGNITRQEAVSMVPPLFLDVHKDHFVLMLGYGFNGYQDGGDKSSGGEAETKKDHATLENNPSNLNSIYSDDDENSFRVTQTPNKSFKSSRRIGDRRITRLLASNYWKPAPKLNVTLWCMSMMVSCLKRITAVKGSTSKRSRSSTPRVTNRRMPTVTRDSRECCSSGRVS